MIDPKDHVRLAFDVTWLMDGKRVHEENNLLTVDLPAKLKEENWAEKSRLGVDVSA